MSQSLVQKPTEILITGGCGFIGSNFVRYILEKKEHVRVINIDNLTYAGNLANLTDVDKNYPERYLFIRGDIADKEVIRDIFKRFEITWVINFAAESHVDRSVMGPEIFVRTNIIGTFNLLEAARSSWAIDDSKRLTEKRFLHISTDEVYGSVETGFAPETAVLDPSSPYSASKAGIIGLAKVVIQTAWLLSRLPYALAGISAAFSTLSRRRAWARVFGLPGKYRMRNGGIPLSFATCVTAE